MAENCRFYIAVANGNDAMRLWNGCHAAGEIIKMPSIDRHDRGPIQRCDGG